MNCQAIEEFEIASETQTPCGPKAAAMTIIKHESGAAELQNAAP